MASFWKAKKLKASSGKRKRSRGKFKLLCGLFDRESEEESVNPSLEFAMGKAESKRIQVVDKTPDVAFGRVPCHQAQVENIERSGESNAKLVNNQGKMKAETNELCEDDDVGRKGFDNFAEHQESLDKVQLVIQHMFDTESNANYTAQSDVDTIKDTVADALENNSSDNGHIYSDEEEKVRGISRIDEKAIPDILFASTNILCEAPDMRDQSDSSDADTEKSPKSNSSYTSCEEHWTLEGDDCVDGEEIMKGKTPQKKGIIRLQSRLLDAVLQQKLDDCSADYFVQILNSPSAKIFAALRTKLRKNNQEWNQEFLELQGLDSLFNYVDVAGQRKVTQLSDALLLLECVDCIKALMNSKIGMQYLVQHSNYVSKLTKVEFGIRS